MTHLLLVVVSRRVIEQIARDSHQGPSREIPAVQEGFALVDPNDLLARQKEGILLPVQKRHASRGNALLS